jgi:urease accessory protein
MDTNWRLLQLADAAFPSGGFAHSAGLEAALQAREVTDAKALFQFSENALWQAGQFALPLIRAVYTEPETLTLIDARADSFLANHVANRQSRTQGRALLATAASIFPRELSELRTRLRAEKLCLHLAPVSAAIYQTLGLNLEDAQRLFLFTSLRGVLSAAVRLGLVGTHEAQAQQAALAGTLDEVFAACSPLGPNALAQTAPLADLLSAAHDRLYSRLFQS